jgi:hypothetical protein
MNSISEAAHDIVTRVVNQAMYIECRHDSNLELCALALMLHINDQSNAELADTALRRLWEVTLSAYLDEDGELQL